MNKKRLVSLLLAANVLATATGSNDSKNNIKEETDSIKVESVSYDHSESVKNAMLKYKEDNFSLESEPVELEPNIITVRYGYVTKDTEMVLDSGEPITLDKYQSVVIYNESDALYYVENYDGMSGIVLKKNVDMLPGTYVEVDISTQTVRLYVDSALLLADHAVTGKDSTPTHVGYFKIDYKARKQTLRGPGYASYVNYWMPFDGDRGLHDALWRTLEEFLNSETYHKNGSHGCVNLPLEVAETIYYNVEAGTRVLVHK